MKILAVELSSPKRSVAVVMASGERSSPAGELKVFARDAEGLTISTLDMIEGVLGEAQIEREQIDCLAVGLGPGSYMGIRMAIALAQGWQLAREIRLVGISSIECLAAQAHSEGLRGRVELVVDAQRNEFYLAGYELGAEEWHERDPLRLATMAEVQERQKAGGLIVGPEATKWFSDGKVVFPGAAMLGRLAVGRTDFVSGEKLEPIYLRETQFVKAPPLRKDLLV
jgi:tRNA threonylcarbamoyl adenosine modification protein YeaZ